MQDSDACDRLELKVATHAIELNPGSPDNWFPYNLRGMAHLILKQYAEAAEDWRKARQFNLPWELLSTNP